LGTTPIPLRSVIRITSHLLAFSIYGYVRGRQIVGATECRGLLALEGAWHVKVGVGNFFLGQSIGIDQSNTFQLQFYSSVKTVGATVLGGLLALKTAWHPKETNLHCLGISRMHVDVDVHAKPRIAAFIVSGSQRSYGQRH